MQNEHLYGRFGDTDLVETSSGEKWHVNKLEKDIIDRLGKTGEDYVETVGAGTIHPITGHKEQFPVAAAIAVLGMGMKLYGMYQSGKQAQSVDSEGAARDANVIAGAEQESAWDEYKSERVQQFKSSMGKVTGAAQQYGSNLIEIFKKQEQLTESTGLREHGETKADVSTMKDSTRDAFGNVTATVQDEYDYAGTAMNLSQRKEFTAIEERLQSRMDAIASIPDTFGEGFWNYNNYQIGA